MPYTTLIDVGVLARHLDDPQWAVVDCRFRLDEPAWGDAGYVEGHIPGAVYADLERDLSGEKTGSNGRHPLPAPDRLTALFGRLGIDGSVQVVAYDQDNGMFASRLWWQLRWLGHRAVAVLDGGLAAWIAAGFSIRSGRETRLPRSFAGTPQRDAVVSAADVESLIARGDHRLLDARAPERFAGAMEPIDRAAGHIPGAVNYHFLNSVDERGRFRGHDELRRRLEKAIGDTAPDRVVSYCGSGVTACHNLLAMEHAGLSGGKLYPGSWSEWSSDSGRPIATGS